MAIHYIFYKSLSARIQNAAVHFVPAIEKLLRQVSFCTNFTASGSKWLRRDLDAHCLSLTQNLALKAQLGVTALKNFPKGIPYDCSCPAAQNIMERRLCSKYGLYLASIKEVSLHEQIHKKQKATPSDIPSEPPSMQSVKTD